jgi:septal ring factor EnvC (AmiA/AmiB activator)
MRRTAGCAAVVLACLAVLSVPARAAAMGHGVAGIASAAAAAAAAARAPAAADAEARLAELSRRTTALAGERQRTASARAAALGALRESDTRVAEADARARAAEARAARLVAVRAASQDEHDRLTQRLATQRAQLARLVRASDAAGRHGPLDALLGADALLARGRRLAYQQYVQQQRARQVQGVRDDLARLTAVNAALAEQQAVADAAATEARAAVAALDAERRARRETLAGIEAAFQTLEARWQALGRDRRAVEAVLRRLPATGAQVEPPRPEDDARGFAARRGRLPLPVQGAAVRQRFGDRIPGDQRSEGVRFAVARGTPVRAVAPGRVVYADWLRGYGLLLILDHGDGWMSLYAQGDRLERRVGDRVRAGEPIAVAGHSGGARESGVYFELRRNGQALDPRGWWR